MNVDIEFYSDGECQDGIASVFRGNSRLSIEDNDIPRSIWRRSSDLSRSVLLLSGLINQCCPNYIVFASRYGEIKRTTQLLGTIANEDELSPMQFSQSVYSTAPGLLTISSGAKIPFTTISAGSDSLLMAVTEAISRLKTDPLVKVLVICADESLPKVYHASEGTSNQGLVALLLKPGGAYSVEIQNDSIKEHEKLSCQSQQGNFILSGQQFSLAFKRTAVC
ncbi:beta-ketoacyl synthase chain length factor [Thaumasiovibrio sp. DFM-14]|uniref:beta-ketoacyl synthase chain length factor n=1 Tax=Thaumasiovibrio sp. DFM-14 TaxID=3384792 RepID=UPI0039A32AD6